MNNTIRNTGLSVVAFLKRISFWLVCGLFGFAGALIYQSFHPPHAAQAATTPAWNDGRKFYLTPTTFPANEVVNACEAGYHMANFWEIRETAILRIACLYSGETQRNNAVFLPTNPAQRHQSACKPVFRRVVNLKPPVANGPA